MKKSFDLVKLFDKNSEYDLFMLSLSFALYDLTNIINILKDNIKKENGLGFFYTLVNIPDYKPR